ENMKSYASVQTTRGNSFSQAPMTPVVSKYKKISSDKDMTERSPLVNSAALNSTRYTAVSVPEPDLIRTSSEQTLNGDNTPTRSNRNYGSIDSILTRSARQDHDSAKEYYANIFSTNFPKRRTNSSSRLIELDEGEEEETSDDIERCPRLRNQQDGPKPRQASSTPFIEEQIKSVNEAVSGVIDRIMGRRDRLVSMRTQTDRLDGVTQMFRRNGQVAETEAWVQRVKATSFAELLYFMVVVIGSGIALLIFLYLIQYMMFIPTYRPPTNGVPGGTPGMPAGGGGVPQYPQYPPYCIPYPQQPPAGGTPGGSPGGVPGGGIPGGVPPGSTAPPLQITPGILQGMNFFVFCCILVYIAKRISKSPQRDRVDERGGNYEYERL
ncbi:hypothetical protein BDR26DRAFT_872489, partial [Obelidium mucronatum]